MNEIFLDTETTGLSANQGHKIVEIACVETSDLLPTKKIFHKILKPQRDVPVEAFTVHGFSTEFLKEVRERAKSLQIDAEMLKRPVNVGFSGGEKKRNEILQMAMLEPKMCILDETDSGLDVDAMKLVSEGVNSLRDAGRGFLVITHYQRLLDHIKPDVVHIMANGRIVKTGGPELALEVENNGYSEILAEVA